MRIFFSDEQQLHDVPREFVMGALRPAMENPRRTQMILEALQAANLGQPERPAHAVPERILKAIHRDDLLDFLAHLYERWANEYPASEPFPEMGIAPGMRRLRPESLRGQLVYHCFDTGSAVGRNTWQAALASIATAAAGAEALVAGEQTTFSLSRPPGHHAGSDYYGGYCYLNNAAIAAQTWLDLTQSTCAILDVDFHHGNGTQEIFYERDDVFFASLHRSPSFTYPFFSGYEDERGSGRGLGRNLNLPLSRDTTWAAFDIALLQALDAIAQFRPSALVVSLGVDTFHEDPVGGLGLQVEDFRRMGNRIKTAGLPTVVVMEGGYSPFAVGTCVSTFLSGLAETAA